MPTLSPEMQTLVDTAVKARTKLRTATAKYKEKLHEKLQLDAEVKPLRQAASAANEEYAKLWQVTKELLPKEE